MAVSDNVGELIVAALTLRKRAADADQPIAEALSETEQKRLTSVMAKLRAAADGKRVTPADKAKANAGLTLLRSVTVPRKTGGGRRGAIMESGPSIEEISKQFNLPVPSASE